MHSRVLTLELLAAAYQGSRANLENMLTHAYVEGASATVCGQINSEHLVDEYGAADPEAIPTCKICARKDPRNA